MYKRVDTDVDTDENINGYSFVDGDGDEFAVCIISNELVRIINGELGFLLYKEDIPLLIKALAAAYNHYEA